MRRIVLFGLIIVALFLIAAAPLQEVGQSYREIFTIVLGLLIAALGSPITQFLKNKLGWSEKAGVMVTIVVAGVVALLEIFLSGQLNLGDLTLETFPQVFFMVFSIASIYYGLLKSTAGFFGRGALLKESG